MSEKREIKRNVKHRSNPFTADLVVKTKDKQVKVTSLGTDNNVLVNQDTGETQGTHVVTYKKVDEQEFIKLFTANIALTFDLTAAGIKAFGVLSFALQNSINKDQVFLDELILEDFLKENKNVKALSIKTLYRGINELIKAQILAKSVRAGLYFINPNFVFNGDRVAFTTALEKKKKVHKTEVDYKEYNEEEQGE